jgi:hypothetical protein
MRLQIKLRAQKQQSEGIQVAQKKITVAINKVKNMYKAQGVKARRDMRENAKL